MTLEELEEKNKELEKQLKVAKKALYFYSDMEHCFEAFNMQFSMTKDRIIEESHDGFWDIEGFYPIENGERARRALENMESIKKKVPHRTISETRKQMREMEVGEIRYFPSELRQNLHNYIVAERVYHRHFELSRKVINGKLRLTRFEDYDPNESY